VSLRFKLALDILRFKDWIQGWLDEYANTELLPLRH
jgi:hypothetical protein